MRISLMLPLLTLATPALADVPNVVTDFSPIQSLVQQVMGDIGAPVMLLPAGGDPHDFQMKPSQAQALTDADLVFWDGPELMPGLEDAIATLAIKAEVVSLLHSGTKIRQFPGDEGTDPHAWLDPVNAQAWLNTIAAALAAKDPDNAAAYTANAEKAQASIAALDADLTAQLAPAKGLPIVVFHDAFGYFADHYGLNIAGAIEISDASAPSAARLTEIKAIIADAGAVCVFPEDGRDPKFIQTVTEGTQAKAGGGQDPEGITLPSGPGLYDALLRNLAGTIADCIGSKG